MNKLTYQKYKGLENVITIDLQNDYTVIAITSKDEETNKYNSTLFLKENTIDDWKLIQDAENIEFDGNVRNINSAILKYIATLLSDGFFDYYINRYEYELKCFDIGNETKEIEKLGEKSYKPIEGKLAYQKIYYCGKCKDAYLESEHVYCPTCKAPIDWSDTIDDWM